MTFLFSLVLSLCSAHPTFEDADTGQQIKQTHKGEDYTTARTSIATSSNSSSLVSVSLADCVIECQGSASQSAAPLEEHLSLSLTTGEMKCLNTRKLPKGAVWLYGINCDKYDVRALAVQPRERKTTIVFLDKDEGPTSNLRVKEGLVTIESEELFNKLCTPFFSSLFSQSIAVTSDKNALYKVNNLTNKPVTFVAVPNAISALSVTNTLLGVIQEIPRSMMFLHLNSMILDLENTLPCVNSTNQALIDDLNVTIEDHENTIEIMELKANFSAPRLLSIQLSTFSFLNSLRFNNTCLTDLSFVRSLPFLRFLYAQSCEINNLDPLKNFTNLRILNITGNKVFDLSPLANCSQLKKLTISANPIHNVDCLSNCKKLTRVDAYFVNPSILQEVQKALPQCKFYF